MRGALKVGAIAFVVLLLGGLLITAVGRWRETANRTRCQYHMGQVGFRALWNYTDPAGAFPAEEAEAARLSRLGQGAKLDPMRHFPPGTIANAQLPPEQRLSWCAVLLPYLETGNLAERIDKSKGWEFEANRDVGCTLVRYLICPSQFQKHDPTVPAPTHFIGMAGYGRDAATLKQSDPRAGMFRYDDPTQVGALQRGLSYTMTFVETSRDIGPWIAGGPSTVRGFDPALQPVGPGAQFGGTHREGANAAFADGSVRFQISNISKSIFAMHVTLAEFSEQ